jgi:hypothetical protein
MIDTNIIQMLSGARTLQQWSGLEQKPLIDGGGADTGGGNALPHGKLVWTPGNGITPASMIFNSAKRKQGQPWDNAYGYNPITKVPMNCVYFSFSLGFSISSADLKGNAREFEIELCESGETYDMGWQYKWSSVDGPPAWRMFDQIAGTWVAVPSIPAPAPKAGVFVNMAAFFAVDRTNGVTWHDSLMVDGVLYPVNTSHKKKMKWNPTTNYLHNAAQIDPLGNGETCSMQIKNWNVAGF